ncbi:MAG: (Fe-S)-binding protein [Candidatus Promineifilaceae bacterium]|nr:(Fe-S)-binding protein [Candidatus Promineifilaceae bacterium]
MQIENPMATTENCRYCLMCRHTCPVGHVTRKETLSPHGWGLTIASLKRGVLPWDEEAADVIYSCADCGNCRSHCVTDQPLPTAIAAARAELVEKDLAPAIVYEIDAALQKWGNPYEEQAPQSVTAQGDVALFVGDEAHYVWPSALEAALTLLGAVGVEPVLIGVGRNNGYLASSLGLPETAAALARQTLEELEEAGATRLLLLSAGDYYTFSQLLDERLGISWPEEVELLEFVPYLLEKLDADLLSFAPVEDGMPTAYVDPTHSVRVDGRDEAPRKLLSAVISSPTRELFWREERAHPCGNLALQFTQPDIADHLTFARLDDARQRGAKRVVTEDPGCLAHLQRHAGRFGLEVQGLYELLAAQLSDDSR